MLKKISFLALFLFCGLLISQCRKEPDDRYTGKIPSVINPCDTVSKAKFKADFDIVEGIFGREESSVYEVPTDTLSTFMLKVKANGDYDSYEWQIGEDNRIFTTKIVLLRIPDSETNKRIKVKLVAKKGYGSCTSIPAQVDSVEKSCVVAMPPNEPGYQASGSKYVQAICGTWMGSTDDDPIRKFPVRVINDGYNYEPQTLSSTGLYIYNLPEGCGGPAHDVDISDPKRGCGGVRINAKDFAPRLEAGHNSMYIIRNSYYSKCCPTMRLTGRLDSSNRNKIIIDFVTVTNSADFLRDSVTRRTTFRGNRM